MNEQQEENFYKIADAWYEYRKNDPSLLEPFGFGEDEEKTKLRFYVLENAINVAKDRLPTGIWGSDAPDDIETLRKIIVPFLDTALSAGLHVMADVKNGFAKLPFNEV